VRIDARNTAQFCILGRTFGTERKSCAGAFLHDLTSERE
jgi:hypothetical protein